ncbi:hypothetical protein [Streptomyces sp. NPDC001340]
MSAGSVLRRTAIASATAGVALSLVAPLAHADTQGHCDPAACTKPVKLTTSAYKSYLQKARTPEASATLKAFTKLSTSQQKRFVAYLQDRDAYEGLRTNAKGDLGRGAHITTPYNKDVKFVTDVQAVRLTDKRGTTTVRFKVAERIYDIPVTSHVLYVAFQQKAKHGMLIHPQVRSAGTTNTNGAIAFPKGQIATVLGTGATFTASTSTKATGTVARFGAPVSKQQTLTITHGGYFTAKLTNR